MKKKFFTAVIAILMMLSPVICMAGDLQPPSSSEDAGGGMTAPAARKQELMETGMDMIIQAMDAAMALAETETGDAIAFAAFPEYIDGSPGIMGKSRLTAEQMRGYLLSVYPDADEEVLGLPEIYLEEGEKEMVRGDIAFAQSILETGHFQYEGSAVTPDQHNYCGMGVTRNGLKGESFATAREGVRAQIQHLKAYASTEPLNGDCIDPRFEFVERGIAPSLDGLSRHWAAGGEYGDHIEAILEKIAAFPVQKTEDDAKSSY